ncbi:hypothetical protein AKO1_007991 [Acrasis kona]|uniref:Uncharacterized protein n=1 Tax=Acrasis kona TaxID=1008807 RepID=A0AAW2YPL4_9EUKA
MSDDNAKLMNEAICNNKNIDKAEEKFRNKVSKVTATSAFVVYGLLCSPISLVQSRIYRGLICFPFVLVAVSYYLSSQSGICVCAYSGQSRINGKYMDIGDENVVKKLVEKAKLIHMRVIFITAMISILACLP